MSNTKSRLRTSELKRIEELLKNYKTDNARFQILKIELTDEELAIEEVQAIKNDITELENKLNNIQSCLDQLYKYEKEFVEEYYFNGKKYSEMGELLKNIFGHDSNIDTSLKNSRYASTYKRLILVKLLNLGILE